MTTYTGDLSVYLGSGNIASRPATPSIDPTMTALWFSDDTGELSAYTVASGWTTISGGGGGGSSQLPLTRAFVPELSTWTQLNATGASFAEKTAVGGLTKALQLTSVTGSGVSRLGQECGATRFGRTASRMIPWFTFGQNDG